MQDFRRKDRARPDAAKAVTSGGLALGLVIALAAAPTVRPAMAQVIVDSGVLEALGPAENLPGLLQGPVAQDMRTPGAWPAPPAAAGRALSVRDDPVSAPRSRLHVAPPTRRVALAPVAPVSRPKPATPAPTFTPALAPAPVPAPVPAPAPIKVAAAPMTKPPAPQAVPPMPVAVAAQRPAAKPVAPVVAPVAAPVAPQQVPPQVKIEAVNAAGDALPPPAPVLRAEPQAPRPAPPAVIPPAPAPAPAPAAPAIAALPHTTPGQLSIGFSGEDTGLGPDAQRNLESVAKRLMDDAGTQAQILAYASAPDGNASRARRVSLARALSTRGFLMDRGVAADRIEVRALGDKVPDGAPDRVDVRLVTP